MKTTWFRGGKVKETTLGKVARKNKIGGRQKKNDVVAVNNNMG
jgi:hypothetical protein